jgi:hypothetical protein
MVVFHFIIAAEVKFVPAMVNVKAGPPADVKAGLRPAMVGVDD